MTLKEKAVHSSYKGPRSTGDRAALNREDFDIF